MTLAFTKPVINMVNSVFGSMDAIADVLKLPEATGSLENRINKHEVTSNP